MFLFFFVLPIIEIVCQIALESIKGWPDTSSIMYEVNEERVLSFASYSTTNMIVLVSNSSSTDQWSNQRNDTVSFYRGNELMGSYKSVWQLSYSIDFFFPNIGTESTIYYLTSKIAPSVYIVHENYWDNCGVQNNQKEPLQNVNGVNAAYIYFEKFVSIFLTYFNTSNIEIVILDRFSHHYCDNSEIILFSTFSFIDNKTIAILIGPRDDSFFIKIKEPIGIIDQDIFYCQNISEAAYKMNLHSKIEMTNLPYENLLIIFSYENNTNTFSYYHVNWRNKSINFEGNSTTLLELADFQIIHAVFLNNTEYLAFVGLKDNDKYIGLIDMKLHLLIYNYKSTEEGVIYHLTYINVTQHDGPFVNQNYVSYSEKNKQKKLCPFVKQDEECVMKIPDNYYMNISDLKGNSFINQTFCSREHIVGNKYCLKVECPIGYEYEDGNCKKCDIYLFIEKKCGNNCSFPNYFENDICYNCNDNKTIYYNHNCYKTCDEVYGEYISGNNSCNKCSDNGRFYDHKKCVENCSNNTVYDEDDKDKICYFCEEKDKGKPYKENNTCVNNCSAGFAKNESLKFCYSCKERGQKCENQKCVDNCTSYLYLDNNTAQCYNCSEWTNNEKPYFLNDECYAKCPNNSEVHENLMYCQICKSQNLFLNNKSKCVEQCELYSTYDDLNICYYCPSRYKDKPLIQNLTCVSECEFKYGFNTKEYEYGNLSICEYCNHLKEFPIYSNFSKTCVNKCEEYTETITNKTDNNFTYCRYCREVNEYFFNQKCFPDCPAYTISNTNFTCTQCEENKILQGNFCVENCSETSIHQITEVDGQNFSHCFDCSKNNQSKYQNQCVENCPAETEKENNICKDCIAENKTIYNQKCDVTCPSFTYNRGDGFCVNCYCFGRGECSGESNECKCYESIYYGHSCEIQNLHPESTLTIIPLSNNGLVLKTYKNCFGYVMNESKPKNYSLKWNFSNDYINRSNDINLFTTGDSEEILCLSENILEDKGNKLSLQIKDLKTNKTTSSSIEISTLNNATEINFFGFSEVPSNSPLKVKVHFHKEEPKIEVNMLYQYFMEDENKEIIPLTCPIKNHQFEHFILYVKDNIIGKSFDDRGEFKEELQNIPHESTISIQSISSIINNSSLGNITKIFYLSFFFYKNFLKNKISDVDIENIIDFIKNRSEEIGENGYFIDKSEKLNNTIDFNYSEPRTIFSLFNKLILYSNEYSFNQYIQFSKVLKEILSKMKGIGGFRDSKDQVMSLFRTVDSLITSFKNNKLLNKTDEEKHNNFIDNIMDILKQLSFEISSTMENNGDVGLLGENIFMNITRFGREQTSLTLFNSSYIQNIPKSIKNYQSNWNSLKSKSQYTNESSLPDGIFLRISEKILNNTKKQIDLNDKTDITNISLCVIQLYKKKESESNNSYPYKTSIYLYNTEENKRKIYKNISEFFYEVRFPFPINEAQNPDKKQLRQLDDNDNDNNPNQKFDATNFACVPNEIPDPQNRTICYTHFDYEKNFILCKCNSTDHVSYIEDEKTASFYKEIQFPKLQYNFINILSIILFLSSFFLFFIPTLYLLIMDLYHDGKYLKNYNTKTEEEMQIELYKEFKRLNNTSFTSFAWYLTTIHFPFFAVFMNYSYNNPMFIKYCINLLGLICALIVSCLPFYFIKPFQKKKDFINKRDIKLDDELVHNLPGDIYDVTYGIIVTLISTIIVRIILNIFDSEMRYAKVERETLKKKSMKLSRFINEKIKKTVLLPENWKAIKERIFAFNLICGNYYSKILNSSRKDKYTDYLSYKQKEMTETLISNISGNNPNSGNLIDDDNLFESYSCNERDLIRKSSDDKKTHLISYYNEDLISNNEGNLPRKKTMSRSMKNKGNLLVIDDINKENVITKVVSFTITKNEKSIMKFKNLHKFEKIRNSYIYPLIPEYRGENQSEMSNEYENQYTYQIDYMENITYFSGQIGASQVDINKREICKIRCVSICLLVILTVLYVVMVFIAKELIERYEMYIINFWLIPAFIELTIGNFIFAFIGNIMVSLALFKALHLRKTNCVVKLFFFFFVHKFKIYLYQVRNYITKYSSEFEYLMNSENK